MDQHEQVEILEALARDPDVTARERVGALRLLREIAEQMPPVRDAEVASFEDFMSRRGRRDYDAK